LPENAPESLTVTSKRSCVCYKTIDDALAYREALKPGVTAPVDWQTFIASLD